MVLYMEHIWEKKVQKAIQKSREMTYMHSCPKIIYKRVKYIVKSEPTMYMHFSVMIHQVQTNLKLWEVKDSVLV